MNKVTTLYALLLLTIISLTNSYAQDIQRVRIDFQSPSGYLRPLLLAFTPDNAASDGMDYGYDALCPDNLAEDLNWIIDNQRYVIQGVGEYHESKSYPFGLFTANSGNIQISLNSLENFDTPINVFIYDAMTKLFQQINETSFGINVNNGDYLNRFFITFQNITIPAGAMNYNESLSINDNTLDKLSIRSIANTNEILIDTKNNLRIQKIEIIDILGKKVSNIKNIDATKITIPVKHINSKIIIVTIFTNNGVIRKKLII